MSATEIHQIAETYHLRRAGNRWAGACPKCGGSERTDRFVLFADGGFKCFSCGWAGSRLSWLRQMADMSCRQAHEYEGLPCATSCPHYASCRQGQPRPARQPRELSAPADQAARPVPTMRADAPATSWQEWAARFVARCAANLADQPEALAWLAGRGIDGPTAYQHRLGWCAHDLRVDRAELGLPPDAERPRVWVPAGLVIPVFDADHRVVRIKIRRTEAARERFLPERKYQAIQGGTALPMVLGADQDTPRGAVVVEAELDAIACSAAAPEVLVIGLGSVAMGIPEALRALLETLPVILVALDNDAARDDRPAPGQAATARWWQTWRRARAYQVPAGKDPGEYVADHHGDLAAWLEAGLPPRLTAAPVRVQAGSLSPVRGTPGGEGVERLFLTLDDGAQIEVVRTPEEWRREWAAGNLVWSPRELADVQLATAGLSATDKRAAVRAVMAAREIFAGFVCAGRGPEVAA